MKTRLMVAMLMLATLMLGTVVTPVVAQDRVDAAGTRAGVPVRLALAEDLSTKNKAARVGQRFRLNTTEDVTLTDGFTIPAGSPAVGEVTDVRKKGSWGRSGHINARLLYVSANGRDVQLSGPMFDKGTAGGVGAVAASAVILPAGFLVTGTSARVPAGTIIQGYTN